MKLALLLVAVVLSALGCDDTRQQKAPVNTAAVDFEHHECAACGMIVREQPAPRGQLVHRDGERAYFCSIADMLSYVDVPSPHGKPAAVYVETSSATEDLYAVTTAKRPWTDARTASYVTGIENPKIMGFPVLAYTSEESAKTVATSISGQTHDWDGIRDFSKKRQEEK